MSSVFIGGSRKISRLNNEVKVRIDSICEQNLTVCVGDANGVDKAVQSYLAQRRYRDVIVYCSNHKFRNNIGNWEIHPVLTDAKPGTRHFYEAKDSAMAQDASYGFMIWDGRSKGTLNNVFTLLKDKKSVLVFTTTSTLFHSLSELSQLDRFLQDHGCLDLAISVFEDTTELNLFKQNKDACAGDMEE